VVRPCGQSACSEIALTRRDDLAVQQLHRSAGALHHHAHAALLCILAAAIGPASARQRATLLLVVIPAGHLLLSLSIQAPKSGRRAVQHQRAAVIGREMLASRPPRRNRCSAAVSSLAPATHLGSQRPRHVQAIGADRVPAGSTEQNHPDWFPFVTKTSALISFPPRPGPVTTADVACLRAAGGGYSRHLCVSCRATGN
jgi:hypothetical protein